MKISTGLFIRKRRFGMLFLVALAGVLAQATPPTVPDFGVMLNDDTKLVVGSTISAATATIEANVDSTTANTIIRNVGYGSDLMYYKTTVGSNLGWRLVANRNVASTLDPTWTQNSYDYQDAAKALVVTPATPLDPIRKQAERAKAVAGQEKFYFLSYRMNEHAGLGDNKLNPFIGEFRFNSYTSSPTADDAPNLVNEVSTSDWDRYYDYSKQAVRDDRLALINEFLDRYADVIDGLQLDFERTYTIIQPGQANAANAEIPAKTNTAVITDFVSAIRTKLDALASARTDGKRYYLLVRVPSTIRDCEWCGMDIRNWITNRLVDVVMPALFYDTSHSIPIKEFVDLADPVGAKVYPSVISNGARYTGSRLFKQSPGTSTDSTAETGAVRIGMLRGAVVNYRAQGAAGFEMFGFAYPFTADELDAAYVLAVCPFKGYGRIVNKTFAVTPRRENLWRDTAGLETVTLPVTWTTGTTDEKTIHLTLNMQEILAARPTPNNSANKYLGLRFACTGVSAASDLHSVKVNGLEIYPNTPNSVGVQGAAPALVRTPISGTQTAVPTKTSYIQLEVPTPHMVFPAPLVLTPISCTTTQNSATLTCASTSGLIPGMAISGTNLQSDTVITSITNATTFQVSRLATHNATNTMNIFGPPGITLASCATTSGNANVTCTSTLGLYAGMMIAGAGIPAGSTVSSVTNGTTFVSSANATATGSGLQFNAFGPPGVTLTGCATTNNSETVTCASTAGLLQGMLVTGTGIPSQATVVSVTNGTTFVIGAPATATNTGLTMKAAGQSGVYDLEIKFLSDATQRKLTEVNVGVLYNPY